MESPMRYDHVIKKVAAQAAAILAIALPAGAHAQTTVQITGIVTQFNQINTHADSVTYVGPNVVEIAGFGSAYEIRGLVSGVGWGGSGIVARASNAHYSYQVPFVARWRAHGTSRDFLLQNHGGSQPLLVCVLRDKLDGVQNPFRSAELSSNENYGLPALLNHCTYAAINRRGLRGDGSFSATYLTTEVPPLTHDEVIAVNAAIAVAPGDPGYSHPEIVAGAPVPTVLFNDAATFRDVARAIESVTAGILGKSYRTRICTGTSSGAVLGSALVFGRSVIGNQSLRTGGNFVVPYDPNSGVIFDGFILNGFVYNNDVPRADDQFPISAPVFIIQGRGDERYQQPIRMAHELLTKGVSLNDWLRIYEIKGLTHVPRDSRETVQPSDGDRLGCFVSAAVHNLGETLREGRAPPISRIAGRIQDGALVIDVAGGLTTTVQPILEDTTIDSVQVDAMLTPKPIGPADTERWLAVTANLEHEADAITPPTIACRLGGYRIKFFGAELSLPFGPEQLAAMYGSFKGYLDSVDEVVAELEAAGLYDSRVESAQETALRSIGLFGF
jgi:hypothetical protein